MGKDKAKGKDRERDWKGRVLKTVIDEQRSPKRGDGEKIEPSIPQDEQYSSTGGVLVGHVAASDSISRSSSPARSLSLRKRISSPVSVPLANILNISPHRRRPSLQTRTSGGQISASNHRSRSGSAHSPTISTTASTPTSAGATYTTPSASLSQLKGPRGAGGSTTTLASTVSSIASGLLHHSSERPRMGDSPTVPTFEEAAAAAPLSAATSSPKSAKSEDGKFTRRLASEYSAMRVYDEWNSDLPGEEEEEYVAGVDGKAGIRRIAASRRIISPQSPGQEELLLPAVSDTLGRGDHDRDESSLSLGIIDAARKSKSRSSSNSSARNPFAEAVDARTNTLDSSSDTYSRRQGESGGVGGSGGGGVYSRPGSVPPRRDSLPGHISENRLSKQTDSSSPPSNSSSLRASSLNQIAAMKRQRSAISESQPPKSSSSNSSSEALSTTIATTTRKGPTQSSATKMSLTGSSKHGNNLSKRPHPPSLEPPLPDPLAPRVDPAPASGMYWYRALSHGLETSPLRAHTCTLVGSSVYVFGGCDSRSCFNDLYVFDADSMYWSKPTVQGDVPPPLRAMTTTAVGKKLLIFGGGDGPTYYNDLYILDTVTHRYTKPKISGTLPSKRRAHTACLYKNGLYVFGGGDGVRALNDVWRLDVTDLNKMSWKLISAPTGNGTSSGGGGGSSSGGASGGNTNSNHTSGGNGSLRDSGKSAATASATSLLAVSTSNPTNSKTASTTSTSSTRPTTASSNASNPTQTGSSAGNKARPTARGYHTANMVQNKLIIFGGSDGVECFRDVWVFDVETNVWKCVDITVSYPRLSHTATIIGSYLFVVGGHDGVEYSSEVLLLNLVTMQWDRRKVYGLPPSGRGYHGAVLHDSRLFIIGGFDGHAVFNDTYILELAVSSYYSQISHFTIEV